jgi:hypothetical protein
MRAPSSSILVVPSSGSARRAAVLAPLLFGALLASTLPLSVACRPTNTPPVDTDPGDAFIVTGALTSNACAPGLDPINPLVFQASLRRDGALGYWRTGEQPWVLGTVGRDGEFHFTLRTDVEVYPPRRGTDPDFDPGHAGCVVSMIESIDGRVTELSAADASGEDAQSTPDAGDAGSSASMVLEATNRIELVPASGSDCSLALLSAGGAFPSLPCAAEYELEGEH